MSARQIPLETVFNSNSPNSWRDPIYKNRIHFKFPDSWTDNISKDSIIGIRSLFITKGYRHFNMDIGYKIHKKFTARFQPNGSTTDAEIPSESGDNYFGGGNVNVSKFFDDSTNLKDLINEISESLKAVNSPVTDDEGNTYKSYFSNLLSGEQHLTTEQLKLIDDNTYIESYFEYVNNEIQLVIKTPFNDIEESKRTTIHIEPNYTYINVEGTLRVYNVYTIELGLYNVNDDARNILNFTSEESDTIESTANPIIRKNIWDRNSCILYSNLSYMSEGSYLGHTRKYDIPKLKYYILTSSNKSFWVDLFATCDHNAPVMLPLDNKDELYIEAQLLTSPYAVI